MKTLLGIFAQFIAFVFVTNVCYPTKAHAFYGLNMSEEQFVQIMKSEFDKLSEDQKNITTQRARSMMRVINAQLMKIDFKVKKNQITQGEANQSAREYVSSIAAQGAANLDLDKGSATQLRKFMENKVDSMTLSDLQNNNLEAESYLSADQWWIKGFVVVGFFTYLLITFLFCYPFFAIYCLLIGGVPVSSRYGDLRCI